MGLGSVSAVDVAMFLSPAFVLVAGGYVVGYWLRLVESVHHFAG